MPPAVKQLIDRLRKINDGLSRRARITIIVAATLAMGSLAYLTLADTTSYVPLFTGLSPEDASGILEQLRKDKIPLRIDAGGTAILVPEEQVHETRLTLAGKGLPKGGGVGFEIFDNQKFGISDFAQQVNYRRALQGELERTIGELDAVRSARVHIALAKTQLFVRNRQPVTAAVTLRLHPGRSLPRSSVKAIVHLVSSAVAGLGPDRITVVETSGTMHWSGRSDGGGSDGPLDQQHQLEETLERRVREILSAALGSGRAVVKVTAEVALAATEQMETEFDPDKTVVRSESSLEEKDQRGGQLAAGIPGVRGNLPGGPAPSTGGSGQGSQRKKLTRNYEMNKTTRKRISPAGELKRLSVAVLVDSNALARVGTAPAAGKGKGKKGKATAESVDLKALEEVVKKAVGFSPERGDLVALQSVPFAGEPPEEQPSAVWAITRYLGRKGSWFSSGLAVLVLVGLAWWVMRRKRQQLNQEVAVLDLPRTVKELEGAPQPGAAGLTGSSPRALGAGDSSSRDLATEAARHDAMRSAAVLRMWISGG